MAVSSLMNVSSQGSNQINQHPVIKQRKELLTSVDSDEPVQPPSKLGNSK